MIEAKAGAMLKEMEKQGILKKYFYDIIILSAILFFAGTGYVFFNKNHESFNADTAKEAYVVVRTDNELFGRYPLYEDRDIPVYSIYGHNVVRIEGGRVYIAEASCRDGVCIKSGALSGSTGSIICLPNRLEIYIEEASDKEKDKGGYDTIAW